jgi:uncharacterized protein (DUF433 family)
MTLAAVAPLPVSEDSHGVLRVGGTRVPLETVIRAWQQGETPEQIAQDYDAVALADIYAIVAYYLKNRLALDAYLDERDRATAAVRRQYQARFPLTELRERLTRGNRRSGPQSRPSKK